MAISRQPSVSVSKEGLGSPDISLLIAGGFRWFPFPLITFFQMYCVCIVNRHIRVHIVLRVLGCRWVYYLYHSDPYQ